MGIVLAACACGGDDAAGGTGGQGNAAGTGATSGAGGVGGSGAASAGGAGAGGAGAGGAGAGGVGGVGGSGGSGAAPSAEHCDPLPAPSGSVVEVSPGGSIGSAISSAAAGTTILLTDGTYDVSQSPIWIDKPGITLRSKSGNRDAVVLDGKHQANGTGGIISVRASNVTIAHLTLLEARHHAVHVTGTSSGSVTGTRIHDVVVRDPGEQGIKINPDGNNYADNGEISCSLIELTRPGAQFVQSQVSSGSSCYTGGVDAHGARDWVVRDNHIEGFWCEGSGGNYLSEHAIHFWTGSRDTRVERNVLVDNARAIGFGMTDSGRTYSDAPCPNVSTAGHFGGLIANNFIVTKEPGLFASGNGYDSGISLWHACGANVLHNSLAATAAPSSAAIEWRFAKTSAVVANNLSTHAFKPRDGATASAENNVENAAQSVFVSVAASDLHLVAGASVAIGQGKDFTQLVPKDIDGDPRSATPDIGADER